MGDSKRIVDYYKRKREIETDLNVESAKRTHQTRESVEDELANLSLLESDRCKVGMTTESPFHIPVHCQPQCYYGSTTVVSLADLSLNIYKVALEHRLSENRSVYAMLRRVLLSEGTTAFDLDIGEEVECQRIKLTGNKVTICEPTTVKLLVLRKSFLVRHVVKQVEDALETIQMYPETVFVSGVVYDVFHCSGDTEYCYALPVGSMPSGRYLLKDRSQQSCELHADGTVTTVIKRKILCQERSTDSVVFPTDYEFSFMGDSLLVQMYGEVYQGFRLRSVASPDADYVVVPQDKVAMKAVRLPNTHQPGAAEYWSTATGEFRTLSTAVNFGTTAPLQQLTSAQLSQHFSGAKEDPVREVVTMAFVQQQIAAARSFCEVNPANLFVPHVAVAISCENLVLGTPFADQGSLYSFMERGEHKQRALSERKAQHVMRQLLRGLAFLHDHGVAHQDVSTGNAVLKSSGPSLLSRIDFEDDNQFNTLQVAFIDLAQAVALEPEPEPEPVLSMTAQSGYSEAAAPEIVNCFTPATPYGQWSSCGSSSADGSPFPTPRLTLSRGGVAQMSADEADDHLTCAKPHMSAGHRFKKSPKPLEAWGKRSYRPPEFLAVAAGQEYCPLCFDMWQMGVLLVYLFTGHMNHQRIYRTPEEDAFERLWFAATSEDGALAALKVHCTPPGEPERLLPLSDLMPPGALHLARQLLRHDPALRLTARQALMHDWLSAGFAEPVTVPKHRAARTRKPGKKG